MFYYTLIINGTNRGKRRERRAGFFWKETAAVLRLLLSVTVPSLSLYGILGATTVAAHKLHQILFNACVRLL